MNRGQTTKWKWNDDNDGTRTVEEGVGGEEERIALKRKAIAKGGRKRESKRNKRIKIKKLLDERRMKMKKTGGGREREREREIFKGKWENEKKRAGRGEKWRSRCENRGKLKANKVECGGGTGALRAVERKGNGERKGKLIRLVGERASECTHARKHETRHFYWYYSRVSSRFRGRTSISSSILNEIAARCVKSITGRVVAVQSRF